MIRLPVFLTEQEKQLILSSITNLRDIALFKLFWNTGMRLAELLSIKRTDIESLQSSDNLVPFRVIGKRDKERIIYIDKDTLKSVKDYLSTRKDSTNAVFVNEHGAEITRRGVQYLIENYCQRILHRKISPHKLRHTFASQCYKSNMPLILLQKLLGHSNLATTSIYTHLTTDDEKNIIENIICPKGA